MELLERYLQEIKRQLPDDQQDDIIAEISDDLQSQMEAREAELGRALTSDDETAIIKAYGHPRVVAARYQQHQYLIGPELFPFYWYTVKIVLFSVLGLELVGITISALITPSPFHSFLAAAPLMWPSVLWSLGVVTIAFAVVERAGCAQSVVAKIGVDCWNPRTLPRLSDEEVSRTLSFFEAIVNIVWLLWLLDIPYVRSSLGFVFMGPGVKYLAPVVFAPSWHVFIVIAFIGSLLIVLMDFALLVHPDWTRVRTGTLTIANVLFTIAACIMLPVHTFITLHGSGTGSADTLKVINETIFFSLLAFAIISAVTAVLNVRATLRRPDVTGLNIVQA